MLKNKRYLIADLHLHHLPDWRVEWNEEFIEKFISSCTGDLYILGDVFESKNKIDSVVLNQFLKLIGGVKKKGFSVIWLTGQHDTYTYGISSLRGIKDFGVEVVDSKIFALGDEVFVPYLRDIEEYKNLVLKIEDKENKILFTHMPSEEGVGFGFKGLSINFFKDFKRVFSGDIHHFLDKGNFSYVGAVSQRDWRDAGAPGVIGILDENDCFKRLETDCVKHIVVKNKEDIPLDQKVIVKSEQILKDCPTNVLNVIKISNIDYKKEFIMAADDDGGHEKVLEEYINLSKTTLNKEILLEKGLDLLKKC